MVRAFESDWEAYDSLMISQMRSNLNYMRNGSVVIYFIPTFQITPGISLYLGEPSLIDTQIKKRNWILFRP